VPEFEAERVRSGQFYEMCYHTAANPCVLSVSLKVRTHGRLRDATNFLY
jgi:hypothetical protein